MVCTVYFQIGLQETYILGICCKTNHHCSCVLIPTLDAQLLNILDILLIFIPGHHVAEGIYNDIVLLLWFSPSIRTPCLDHVNMIGDMSSSRCFFFSISSTSRCLQYRVNIVSISCQHRYLVILRLHPRHRDVEYIVSISCQHRYSVIGGLLYLVYIFHIVDIAMLTISCRYRVDIVKTSVPCHTSFTSFTTSTSRCWRYRIDIV